MWETRFLSTINEVRLKITIEKRGSGSERRGPRPPLVLSKVREGSNVVDQFPSKRVIKI